jgi:hypothetical protein
LKQEFELQAKWVPLISAFSSHITMNILVLLASILTFVAFLVHAIQGSRELPELDPQSESPDQKSDSWVQSVAGWHWVSVDLLLSAFLMGLIALTDLIPFEQGLSLILAIYFAVNGVAWLLIVLLNKKSNAQVLKLGQWIFCFLVAGLLVLGL